MLGLMALENEKKLNSFSFEMKLKRLILSIVLPHKINAKTVKTRKA